VAGISGSLQHAFNECVESPEQVTTLVDLLRWRAARHPDKTAAGFLNDESTESVLTYRELDHQARTIASFLMELEAQGERTLLVFPPGLEFITAFFGCLYAGVIAVPTYPPHPARLNRTLPRMQAIAHDSQPTIALTTSSILSKIDELFAHSPDLEKMRWFASDEFPPDLAEDWNPPLLSSEDLAFLQYTSGSTASPKGVMISHGNILHNSTLIQKFFETNEESRGVFWLPSYHDMGLVGGILQTLYCGGCATLMSPLSFLQHPYRWLQTITQKRASTSGGPNFAYDLCVRKITNEQKETLDLSCWTLAFNGAEPIRYDTLERFAAAFEGCGFNRNAFYPCYGLAEGTLLVSGGKRGQAPVIQSFNESALEQHEAIETTLDLYESRKLVGCGRISPDQEVAIVDPETLNRLPAGRIGEIWVSGPSIALGYWNHPDETEQIFHAQIPALGEGCGEAPKRAPHKGPFLRTGDLGFLWKGELYVTGRLKDLIILEGRNHYPQDIEMTVEKAHPALRPSASAVFLADIAGADKLTVVAEVEPRYMRELTKSNGEKNASNNGNGKVDEKEITRAIRRAVAEHHDIQVSSVTLLKTGRIPKTSSGKIQRHACKAGFIAGTLDRI
jgi:acyl-CoA synthetase (AMP-forming)/AMP-acid ligase II